MKIFEIREEELAYLKKKDKKLGKAIEEIGKIERELKPDIFFGLISSVVSQQISGKVATILFGRLETLAKKITPLNLVKLSIEEIRACGISYKKAEYIKNITDAFVSKKILPKKLEEMENEEIIKTLIELDGVGRWTAEMMLIFSLQRKNVLSFNDFGIRKGLCKLYNLETISKEEFEKYRKKFSPYGSIASFYLWEIASTK